MVAHNTVRVKKGPQPGNAGLLAMFFQNMYLGEGAHHRLDPKSEDRVLANHLKIHCERLKKAQPPKEGEEEKENKLARLKDFLESKEVKNGEEHEFTNFRRLYDVLDEKEKGRFVKYLIGINEDFGLDIDIQGLIDGKFKENTVLKKAQDKKAQDKIAQDKKPAHEEPQVFIIDQEPEQPPVKSPEESKNIYSQAMKDMHFANGVAIYARQALGDIEFIKAKDLSIVDDAFVNMENKFREVAAFSDQSKPTEVRDKIDQMMEMIDTNISAWADSNNKIIKLVRLNLKSFRKAAQEFYDDNKIETEDDRTFEKILKDEYPNMVSGLSENEKRRFSILAEKQREDVRKLLKKVKDNFKVLQDCNRHPDGNSVQFNRMFTAAERANALTENSTMMELRNVISDVLSSAAVYNDKINAQGLFGGQLTVGKKKGYYRHQAAKNLKTVATDLLFRMDYMTDPYRSLSQQITHPTMQNNNKQKQAHSVKPGK